MSHLARQTTTWPPPGNSSPATLQIQNVEEQRNIISDMPLYRLINQPVKEEIDIVMADAKDQKAAWWLKEAMVRHMPVIRPISLSGSRQNPVFIFFPSLLVACTGQARPGQTHRQSRETDGTERHSLPLDFFCPVHELPHARPPAHTTHIGPLSEAALLRHNRLLTTFLIFTLPVGSSIPGAAHASPPPATPPFALAQQTCGRVTKLSRIKESSHPGSYARCSGPAPPPAPHRSFRRRRRRSSSTRVQ